MSCKPASCHDFVEVSRNMTVADKLEWRLMSPVEPVQDTLLRILTAHPQHQMFCIHASTGEALLLGGFDKSGVVWMIATEDAQHHPHRCVRGIKEGIALAFRSGITTLHNFMLSSNTLHRNLLEHLGAVWTGKSVYVEGHQFDKFYITQKKGDQACAAQQA